MGRQTERRLVYPSGAWVERRHVGRQTYMYTYMNMRYIFISFLRGSYRCVCVFVSGEFALPPMDGPRVVRAEVVGDRWKDLLLSVPLPHS